MGEKLRGVSFFIDEEQGNEIVLYEYENKSISRVQPYGTMLLKFYETDENIYDKIQTAIRRWMENYLHQFKRYTAHELLQSLKELLVLLKKLPDFMQFLGYGIHDTADRIQQDIQHNGEDFVYSDELIIYAFEHEILRAYNGAGDNYVVWHDLDAVLKTGVFNPREFNGARNASARISAIKMRHGLNIDKYFFNTNIPKKVRFVADHRQLYTPLYPDFRPMVSEYICSILAIGASVKHCEYCAKLFVTFTGHDSVYCNRTMHKDGRNCYQKGSVAKYREKLENEDGLRTFTRYYKRMFARIRYGYLTRKQFEQWKNDARNELKQYELHKYSVEKLEENLIKLCDDYPMN